MQAIFPTAPQTAVDARGRPYFLWDSDLTVDQLRDLLRASEPRVRAYFIGKVMRQAKPDDVFTFVSAREIREMWSLVLPHLGKSREFWAWLFDTWERQGHVWK